MSTTDAAKMNPRSGFGYAQDAAQTYAELSARLRTLLRLQSVARLLLAGGPGDFFGKIQAAKLGQKRGVAELKKRFERVRELFRASFEPIIMEMYGDEPRSLPWFAWWGQPCRKEELFEFALIHASTVACREITFYRKAGLIEAKRPKAAENDFLANLEPDVPKPEPDFCLTALEFDTPSRKLMKAEIKQTLNAIAREFDFQTAKRAENILNRRGRETKSAVQPTWLQKVFLDFWDECPRVDGKLLCGASGAPFSPLCYFDDKSTRHIIHVLARASSAAPPKIKELKDDTINKTWRRLGLVRVRKPIFYTKEVKKS